MVFNRFWRADPARARTTGGTGLGLAISLEDARLHDGWLQAWGAPGKGSRFRLTLPRRAGDPLTRAHFRSYRQTSTRCSHEHLDTLLTSTAPGTPFDHPDAARPPAVGVGAGRVRDAATVRGRPPPGYGPPRPSPGRSLLQPARASEGRDPIGDRLRVPGRDAGQPDEHLGRAQVPLRTAAGTWKPNRGTIVYEAFRVAPTSAGASVRLATPDGSTPVADCVRARRDERRLSRSGWSPRRDSGASTTR